MALDRLAKDVKALRDERLDVLRETLRPEFQKVTRALNAQVPGDLKKTIKLTDKGALAQGQLKARSINALTADEVTAMTKARIPLTLIPGKMVLNPRYTSDQDEGVGVVVAALARLVAANPQAGLPSDLFVTTATRSIPKEDALVRALKMDGEQAATVLPILCDVGVSRGEIDDAVYLAAMTDTVKGLTKKMEAALAADGADDEVQAAPAPRRKRKAA